MKYFKILKIIGFLPIIALYSCSSFNYKTYDEKANENVDDPEPNYKLTLDEDFQDFTNYMFIGNRVENFGTYFNTYFNAKENFNDAYEDYVSRVLASYNEKRDSIFAKPRLSQESIDKFNKSIEKASKVIQFHKSSVFMDRSVLLIGQSYYYLGDYLKAERKFSEFISKLSNSKYIEEAQLYLSKTQMRLDNEAPAMERLENLVKTSKDKSIISESYQSIAEAYLNKKDFDNAIKNFKKAIEFSNDSEFKAQMQFLVATVTEKSNPKAAAKEYEKVLDYDASYDLEYLAKHNYAKNLVLSGNFGAAKSILTDMEVKYKDNVPYLGEINYLNGFYYEQKKESKNAVNQYFDVIKRYPNTVASSDASFRVANYYESKHDYLNAYRYYKFSTEQSSGGLNYKTALSKTEVFKTYFDLRSTIIGQQINTDYDKEFKKNTGGELIEGTDKEEENRGDEGTGKPGGIRFYHFEDSLDNPVDSFAVKEENVAKAKFELAELFLYDLNQPDSCEYYLNEAFNQTQESDFRARILFALAALYRTTNNFSKNEDILRQIINEYPSSSVANPSKRLLNLAVNEEFKGDSSDSLFNESEKKFVEKDYEGALNGFKELIRNYPSSIHLDKAMYAAGWIYENVSMKFDSAYYYYSSLIKAVPNSEAAAIVSQKVTEYETANSITGKDSTAIINDSLKSMDTTNISPTEFIQEPDPSNQSIDNSTQPLKDENLKKEEIPPIEEPKKDDGEGNK